MYAKNLHGNLIKNLNELETIADGLNTSELVVHFSYFTLVSKILCVRT